MGRAFAFDKNFNNRGKGRRKGKISIDPDSKNLDGDVTFYSPPVVGEDQILITSDSNTIKGIAEASATPLFWVVDKADILDTVNRLPGNTSNFTNEAQAYEYLASSDKFFPVKNETLSVTSLSGSVVDLDTTQRASYPNTGSTWYDLSGNGNNATLTNDPKFQSGVLNFDGTNDYATISGDSTISTNKRTVEITFRMNGTYSNYSPLAVYANGSSTSNRVWLGIQDGKFRMHGWGTSDPAATTTIEADKWYTCVWSYDKSTQKIKMYTNGVLENNHSQTQSGVNGSSSNNWYLSYIPGGWQNQTYSDVSIKSFKVYDRILSDDDVKKNYYQSGVALDNITYALDMNNFMCNPMLTQRSQMAYTYNTWNLGSTSATGFGRNGGSDENIIESNTDPFDNTGVIWAAKDNTASSNSDGGWNSSRMPIRNTELYRHSVWVYRKVTGNGRFYFGTRGYNSNNSNVGVQRMSSGTPNHSNPYFWVSSTSGGGLTDGWKLIVGHVHPAGTSNIGNHSDSGRYDTDGDKEGGISYDFIWRDDNTQGYHRTYLYYSTDSTTVQLWAYPRVDIVDGTEPSIADLIANTPNKLYDLKDRSVQMLKNNCILEKNYTEFGGQNDAEITMDDTITLGNGNWTVNMWVNADSLSDYNLLSNSNSGPVTNAFGFHGNKIFYYNYDGAWKSHYGNTTLSTEKWYMLTWVNYAGSSASDGTMKMYVNGKPDSSTFNSYTTNGGPVNVIGKRWSTGANFNGKLSLLFIYSKSLSDAEVGERFAETKGYFSV